MNGMDVTHVIHRHGLDEKTALEVEAALIDAYPGLSNEQGGKHSRDRGTMNALQIQKIYTVETIDEIKEKCLIIKIRQSTVDLFPNCETSKAIYEATRASWKLNMQNAKKVTYVLSVMDGIVKAVYTDLEWSTEGTRWKFEGKEASKDIQNKYVGKRIPAEFRKRGIASPCLYVNL